MSKPETALSQKRVYVQPQISVVEIDGAEIICSSGQDLDYDDRYRRLFGEG